MRDYLDAGFGLLLVGYRGYGGNPGKPSEEGLYLDGRAALAFLAADGVIPENLVLYGESLGTGIAVQLASDATGTPSSAPWSWRLRTLPLPRSPAIITLPAAGLLVKDRFDSAAKIALVGAPVFIFHGDRDRTIPIRFGKGLFAAAVEPKVSLWLAGPRTTIFTNSAPPGRFRTFSSGTSARRQAADDEPLRTKHELLKAFN